MKSKLKFGIYPTAIVKADAYGGPKISVTLDLCRLQSLPEKGHFYADKVTNLEYNYFGFDRVGHTTDRYVKEGIDPVALYSYFFPVNSKADDALLEKLYWQDGGRFEVSCYNLGSQGAPESLELACKAQEFAADRFYSSVYDAANSNKLGILRDHEAMYGLGFFCRFMLGLNMLGVKTIIGDNLSDVKYNFGQFNAGEVLSMWQMTVYLRELANAKLLVAANA